ncbi:MAG: hypothetical protein AAGD08_10185 [Pseudomonadota bacterium]
MSLGNILNLAEAEYWPYRYPDLARGVPLWREAFEAIPGPIGGQSNAVQWFRLRAGETYRGAEKSPLVFISHRQADTLDAVDLAVMIVSARPEYDVWLDVWDPALRGANGDIANPTRGLLIALAIEMGLLNATCLVALFTQNAAGSAWIPYEYGRVKPKTPFAGEVAARIDDGANEPEYLSLGVTLRSDQEVLEWLP